jgi:hypothetical protein
MDNGAEFTASIISQLKDLWPECKIVHGKPGHPQSQGSVERANVVWCSFNSRMVAKVFLKLHKFYSNLPIFTTVFTHPCYGHISYICVCPLNTSLALWFGVEAKVGLTSSSLPDEIISKISTEDDLKDITNTGFRND